MDPEDNESNYHLIGIGGAGMSALAHLLLDQKQSVQGSDVKDTAVLQELRKRGAKCFQGHDAELVEDNSLIVYSSAISEKNPEWVEARKKKLSFLHRSDLLSRLMEKKKALLVTGTHGKTTTTALLTEIFEGASLFPSFAIGAKPLSQDRNARWQKGAYFIAEGDESDGSFLKHPAFGAIVTNLEEDHLYYWKTPDLLKNAFRKFFEKVESKQHCFWNIDDAELQKINPDGVSFGFSEKAALRALNFRQEGFQTHFDISFEKKVYRDVILNMVGEYNVLNALAAFGLALRCGIDESLIRIALSEFRGVEKRQQKKREFQQVTLFDDYAHHPTEVKKTLSAMRKSIHEKRLIVIFEPHRYERLARCMEDFAQSFDAADRVFVTEVFSAGDRFIEDADPKVLVHKLKERKIEAEFVSKEKLADQLALECRPHDVVITLGAGNISSYGDGGFDLYEKKPRKLKVGLMVGGKSLEHEISLISGKNIFQGLNSEIYEIELFGIAKDGKWIKGNDVFERLEKKEVPEQKEVISSEVMNALSSLDVCFPVLHGPWGEDGMVQGLFKTLEKPYVGCDFRSSALCMQKAWTKDVALRAKVPTPKFFELSKSEWQDEGLSEEKEKLVNYPVFVKPSHYGSSVGISRAKTRDEMISAIDYAFQFDEHLIVEHEVRGRQIEFAVLGNNHPTVPDPGEILSHGEFYDYEKKYGDHPMETKVPADLSDELKEIGKRLALRIYKYTGCCGMARVDFFLDEKNHFYLNEINPIPGFTSISLYPQMWEKNGVALPRLLDRLIILAMERVRLERKFA